MIKTRGEKKAMIRQTPYGMDIGLLGKESENPVEEKEEAPKTEKKRKTSKKKTEAASEAESEE